MAITLARPELATGFVWAGDAWLADTIAAARIGLVRCASDAIAAAKADPDTPVRTEAMKRALRVVAPGYAGDDTPPKGVDPPVLWDALRVGEQDARALTTLEEDGVHTWVGSFVRYAYYQHQGFVHYQSRRFVTGYPFVVKHAEPALSRFDEYFREAWPTVRYGGA